MNTNFRSALYPLVLLLSMGSAMADNTPAISVSYQDLNLTNASDVRVLYGRLKHAARDVCGDVPAQQLERHLAFEHCYRLSLERAVMQIDVPQLMAMYQSDTAAPTDRG